MKYAIAASLLTALCIPAGAWAHGENHGKKAAPKPAHMFEEKAFGRPGDPARVTRVIEVGMHDRMRFTPERITVKQGEVVKFVVGNDGKIMHEMVIGTMKELKEHHEVMKKHPGMEHDEPYMAHVSPGKQQRIVWQFTQPGEFHYACLIPGHFEAGMIGRIVVEPAKEQRR